MVIVSSSVALSFLLKFGKKRTIVRIIVEVEGVEMSGGLGSHTVVQMFLDELHKLCNSISLREHVPSRNTRVDSGGQSRKDGGGDERRLRLVLVQLVDQLFEKVRLREAQLELRSIAGKLGKQLQVSETQLFVSGV